MAGELEALRFTARERGHRLAELQVFEAHGRERFEAVEHRGFFGEEDHGFADRHVEHIGDVHFAKPAVHIGAGDAHFEGFGPVARAIAIGAAQIHVGQELHLDMFEAGAATGRATAIARIEAESAGGIAARLGFGRAGEHRTDRIEGADITRRVGARGLADRALIDHDHVFEQIDAEDGVMRADRFDRFAERLRAGAVKHVLHERGFARARDAGDGDQPPERQTRRHAAQIVFARAAHFEPARIGRDRAARDAFIGTLAAGQVGAGQGVGVARLRGRTVEDDFAAAFAGAGADVEDAVGCEHDLRIVLDHHQRIAGIAQPVHDFDHPVHVARMQADRRFVEHEQRVDERSAERGGQVDALDLAARKRAALPVEREVTQAHIAQKARAGAQFVHQQFAGFVEHAGQFERRDEIAQALDRHRHQIVNREAGQGVELGLRPARMHRAKARIAAEGARGLRVCAHAPEQRIGLQARAAAGLARRIAAVLREQHADVHLVGLAFEPCKEALDAIPLGRPGFIPAHEGRVAVQQPLLVFVGQVAIRHIERDAVFLGALDEIVLAFLEARGLPRLDRTFGQGFAFVGDDQPEIDADHAAEATAGIAGTERRIERERGRRRIAVGDVAFGAMQSGREPGHDLAARRVVGLQVMHGAPALAHAQRGFERFGDARALGVADPEPILDHLQHARFAMHVLAMDAGIALGFEMLAHFVGTEIGRHPDLEADEHTRIAERGGAFGQRGQDGFGCIALHRLAA